jgi:hypothetical protein
VVASKFFPIDGPDGKQYPLCERDYFRRLNLICAQCGMALRGSYITACSALVFIFLPLSFLHHLGCSFHLYERFTTDCIYHTDKKFHVEHFTCSLCDTLFGPQDSYYEHEGDVYCHYHYSTRFATKCAGCNSAILKQFVEINRNNRDECWHPECYMINKVIDVSCLYPSSAFGLYTETVWRLQFWNVKLVSRRSMILPAMPDGDGIQSQNQSRSQLSLSSEQQLEDGQAKEPAFVEEEKRETAMSLKDKQGRMEQQVYRIWT